MKCYVLHGTAGPDEGRHIVFDDVFKVFANKELGENYIRETWPEAQYRCDDNRGQYWILKLDETWTAYYQLLEKEIEGL